MKHPKRGGRSARIQRLKRLRLALSGIAVILCGVIAFCAVILTQNPQDPPRPTACTETVQTAPPSADGEPTAETMPQTIPQTEAPVPETDVWEETEGQTEEEIPDDPGEETQGIGLGQPESVEQQEMVLDEGDADMLPVLPAIPDGDETEAPTEETQTQTTAATEPSETEPAETSAAVENEVPPSEDAAAEPEAAGSAAGIALMVSAALLVLDLAGIVACTIAIGTLRRQSRGASSGGKVDSITHTVSNKWRRTGAAPAIAVGQLHNIGARPCQEDSSGVANLDDGVFAVVADGMGGLSGGDKVSQKIVYTMLEYSSALRPGQMDGTLERMLDSVTDEVNQMLGQAGLKKSGSTLMAVLVRDFRFHWVAVGDSHIYLYHGDSLIQLNQEHNRGQDLLRQAIAGQLTFDEVRADPKKSGLTSYIGMGMLRYVEKSLYSIPLTPGDRILLMTDGVFNTLPEDAIRAILRQTPDVTEAARQLERAVIARACPHQDNFTAVILGL